MAFANVENLRKLELPGRDGAVQKDVLIAWDIENAKVPVGVPVEEVERAISNAFQYLQRRKRSGFLCALSQGSLKALQHASGMNGVEYLLKQTKLLLAAGGSKAGSTDTKLVEEIESFISRQSHDGKAAQSVLVVITGDDDFTKSIRLAMNAGMDVEVLHPPPPTTSANLLKTISGRPNIWHHDWLEFLDYWLRTHNKCTGLPDRLQLPQRTSSFNNGGSGGQGAWADAGPNGGDAAGGDASSGGGGADKAGYRTTNKPPGGNRQAQAGPAGQEDTGPGFRQRKPPRQQYAASSPPPPPPPPQPQQDAQPKPQGTAAAAAANTAGATTAGSNTELDWEQEPRGPSMSARLHLSDLTLVRWYSEPALALSAVINWLLRHRYENTEWLKALRSEMAKSGCRLILGKDLYATGQLVVSCPIRPAANLDDPEQHAVQTARRARDRLRSALTERLLEVPGSPTGAAASGNGCPRPEAFWPPSFLDRLRSACPTSRLEHHELRDFLERQNVEVPTGGGGGTASRPAGHSDLLRLVNLVLMVEAELGLEPSTLPAADGDGARARYGAGAGAGAGEGATGRGPVRVLVPVDGSASWSWKREEERAAVRSFLAKRFTIGQLLARLRERGLQADGVEKADLAVALASSLQL